MKCQICGKNPASAYMKMIVNGELTEHAMCSECAQKTGYGNFLHPFSLSFHSLLGSFFGSGAPEMTDTVRCSGCGSSFGDIAQTGKVGCSQCYTVFRERMLPSIQRIHGNTSHCGKQPTGSALQIQPEVKLRVTKPENELEKKKKELQSAIQKQDFERAAVLRDEISRLEGSGTA